MEAAKTNELERVKPVYEILNQMFQCYLMDRDVDGTLAFLTEDIISLGAGNNQAAFNKAELKRLLDHEVLRFRDGTQFEIRGYYERVQEDGRVDCCCMLKVSAHMTDQEKSVFHTRLTASARWENGGYRICMMHMSEARDVFQEKEFFPPLFFHGFHNLDDMYSQNDLLKMIFQMLPGGLLGVYMEPDLPLYMVSDGLLIRLGYGYREFMEMTQGKISNIIYPEDREFVWDTVCRRFETGRQIGIEYRMIKKDGSYLWIYDIGCWVASFQGKEAMISLAFDRSDDVRVKQRLLEESKKDSLTGIYNRNGGVAMIQHYLRRGDPYIFLILDVDNFKSFNDTYGHIDGDRMLKYTADLLARYFRKSDILVRLGGDEFIVFGCPCRSWRVIEKKLDQILVEYKEYVRREYPKVESSLSIGGVWDKGQTSFDKLYQQADALLYEVKRDHKGTYKIQPFKEEAAKKME